MIPSDHFVMLYNEIFKFLVKQGPDALDRYYERVAARQGNFTLDEYRRKGLKGVYDYYCRIRREENCDLDLRLTEDCLRLKMNRCPSLAKALESDAGACPVYCDHCPGWCLRVMARVGLWEVYDMKSRAEPVCDEWVYTDRAKCRAKYRELLAKRGPDLVRTNLDDPQPYIANRLDDSARFESLNPRFKTAFGFLRDTDLAALKDGKVEIDGDSVFAYVSSPTLKPFDEDGEAEAHRAYVDIHAPIVGEETVGTHTMTERELSLPFNVKDDYVLFKARGEPLTLRAGEFAAFFPPYGAHRPGCTREKTPPRGFRKICVKVKA